jgi:hypothetical protein
MKRSRSRDNEKRKIKALQYQKASFKVDSKEFG